ncbi:MAG: HlyD family efflux transporter periplasmic adaptor subunit [Rhodocyclaceae bacterium]|nr:HlyD family efflux transporter periplasmic adaptor subunit [Rhodocyclaceae bacterium]
MNKPFFPLKRVACVTLAALGLALSAPASFAGDGHDHVDAPAAVSGNGPKRQPDGRVFLPKPAQHQLGIRSLTVTESEQPKVFELSGKVIMDPNAGGKVQAALAGRLAAGPQGLPVLGQRVHKGDILAYVIPTSGAIERSNQVAQHAELQAARSLAEKRLARLKELSDTVPRKDIEAAESELASLTGRLQAVGAGLSNRDALVAPVSGVIASANAVAGQVLEARELVYEVVDPSRLHIEALAYDSAQAQSISSAYVAIGSERVPLKLLGAARSLRDQALPIAFAGQSDVLASLAVGQPVKVFAQTTQRTKGVQVPLGSVLKNPANQAIVWVKEAPEMFEPRLVTYEPLDGASVTVTSGVKAGERVATQGASFINQVR